MPPAIKSSDTNNPNYPATPVVLQQLEEGWHQILHFFRDIIKLAETKEDRTTINQAASEFISRLTMSGNDALAIYNDDKGNISVYPKGLARSLLLLALDHCSESSLRATKLADAVKGALSGACPAIRREIVRHLLAICNSLDHQKDLTGLYQKIFEPRVLADPTQVPPVVAVQGGAGFIPFANKWYKHNLVTTHFFIVSHLAVSLGNVDHTPIVGADNSNHDDEVRLNAFRYEYRLAYPTHTFLFSGSPYAKQAGTKYALDQAKKLAFNIDIVNTTEHDYAKYLNFVAIYSSLSPDRSADSGDLLQFISSEVLAESKLLHSARKPDSSAPRAAASATSTTPPSKKADNRRQRTNTPNAKNSQQRQPIGPNPPNNSANMAGKLFVTNENLLQWNNLAQALTSVQRPGVFAKCKDLRLFPKFTNGALVEQPLRDVIAQGKRGELLHYEPRDTE